MVSQKKGKVRYAVVALGHIAQKAILPAFKNASKNSELAALVSSSPKKLKALGKEYGVELLYDYSQYDECLRSGYIDAVFLALPNDMHRDYATRAARAGIHVLCEKPLAVTAKDCQAMIKAAEANDVKLMTAYRLHFEETNLSAIELIQSGKLGEPRYFNSIFSFEITDPDNIRLKKKRGGGTLYDIGVYCINAARYLFQAEPQEVTAVSANNGDKRFKEVDEMVSAILRFPGERLATFTVSFGSAARAMYEVVGTKGSIRVEPAYEYEGELSQEITINDKTKSKTFAARDQFASEILYFSDCILKGEDPEPSGEEGLIDVAIVEALTKSIKTGRPVSLPKFTKKSRPGMEMNIKRPPVKNPRIVKADSPHD
ncbi:MAG: Gfo/Idh/MocA family protein [Verrucomicrobiales bacterium]